jgi:FMN phosphatase YigB (HAD superfamily)
MGTMPSAEPAEERRTATPFVVEPPHTAPRDAARPAAVEGLIFDTADVLYDATLWRRWLVRLVNHLGITRSGCKTVGDCPNFSVGHHLQDGREKNGTVPLFRNGLETSDWAAFLDPWDRQYLPDVCRGRREHGEALSSFLLAAGLSWAQVDEVEAASRVERQNLELNVRPFSGVVKTIGQLARRGLPMVAWADSPYPAAKLAERMDRLGLAGSFRAVLSSFDLEAVQPAARCYQSALEVLGTAPHATMYVGHDAAHLLGAKAIGLRTAAFNYQSQAAADHHLTQFEDLLTVVDRADGDSLTAAARREPALNRAAEESRA